MLEQLLANECRSARKRREAKPCHHDAPDVPESLTRLAREIFPVRLVEMPARGTHLPIEVIYDSFLVPAPVGLGATWHVRWQGLYGAGGCWVGLRIEPERRFRRVAVFGQITNRVLPEMEMGSIPVSLRSGKQVVAETMSNRFGEFQMAYEQQARLRLCICLEGGSKTIQVPLKRVTGERTTHSLGPRCILNHPIKADELEHIEARVSISDQDSRRKAVTNGEIRRSPTGGS